jgi:hypothetical protein
LSSRARASISWETSSAITRAARDASARLCQRREDLFEGLVSAAPEGLGVGIPVIDLIVDVEEGILTCPLIPETLGLRGRHRGTVATDWRDPIASHACRNLQSAQWAEAIWPRTTRPVHAEECATEPPVVLADHRRYLLSELCT